MNWEPIIRVEAQRQGVPGELAVAVARRESGMRQRDDAGRIIMGRSGEIGMMQLKPGTAAEVGVDPYDANDNIRGGIRYLRKQYDRFGNWQQALQAYNGGAAHVQRGSVSEDAWNYARGVLAAIGIGTDPTPAPAPAGAPSFPTFQLPWGNESNGAPAVAGAGVQPEQIAAGVAIAAGLYLAFTSL